MTRDNLARAVAAEHVGNEVRAEIEAFRRRERALLERIAASEQCITDVRLLCKELTHALARLEADSVAASTEAVAAVRGVAFAMMGILQRGPRDG